jgi:hypothetical protein
MGHQTFVVKESETTDLYLVNDVTTWAEASWGQPERAITFETLADAQARAAAIGHGTVGTAK